MENCLLRSPFTYFLSPMITEKTIGSCERVLSPDRLRLRAYWDIMTQYRPTAHISGWTQAHRLQSITSHLCFAFIGRARSSPRPTPAPAPPAPETLPLFHLDVSGGIMRAGFISFKQMINLHGHAGAEGQKWRWLMLMLILCSANAVTGLHLFDLFTKLKTVFLKSD